MAPRKVVHLNDRPHALYRFYDRADLLLYIGITVNLPTRLTKHRGTKEWWLEVDHVTIEHFPSRREVLKAESAAIKAERPLYNVQHNDVEFEEEDETDEARDLAVTVLGSLDDDERNAYLRDHAYDAAGNPVPERQQYLDAANAIVTALMWERRHVELAIRDAVDFAPGGRGPEFHKAGHARKVFRSKRGEFWSDMEILVATFERMAKEYAEDYLRSLPADEAEEWMACSRVRGDFSDDLHIRWAARYAFDFKDYGYVPADFCHAPGMAGARCPSRSEYRVWYQDCPMCPVDSECRGHTDWCERHMGAVLAEVHLIVDDERELAMPFPVINYVRCNPDEEMPF